uniref:3-hydroxyacyl-[acyl-carrier-protein] dehydratase n=1 Tax=Ananas comosus var. bracteatus TaxID=296719 RepID=A0A6V7PPM2_ANACO|nr:unnamed protein product [Ananas comosus var. bracteatus]
MEASAMARSLLYTSPLPSHSIPTRSHSSPELILHTASSIRARNLAPLSLSTKSSKRFVARCAFNGEEKGEAGVPIEKKFPPFPTVMDINQIREILPHRFPFLLVDRVIEYKPGVTAVGIKNVTINDNFFPGHFPERPIMPGVLMVEAMAQVGGLVMLQPEVGGSRENFFFAGIDKVRFRKPVIAGDTLVMRMTLVKLQKRFGIAKMEGKAYVGGDVVCEGEFLMATGSE